MYRLVEENRNIERQLVRTSLSSTVSPVSNCRLVKPQLLLQQTPTRTRVSATAASSGSGRTTSRPNKSPPRLPYDELQMDQLERQQQRQQQQHRSSLPPRSVKAAPQSPLTYRRRSLQAEDMADRDNSLDSGSNHSTGSANTSCTIGSGGSGGASRQPLRSGSHESLVATATPPPATPPPATPPPAATTSSYGVNPTAQPPARRGLRKSHPWQTDVKINRFSSTSASSTAITGGSGGGGGGSGGRPPLSGSSRTQQSTLGWKQRMQERRAVFGNVAVPEQSFDDDDDDDDDDLSRGEKLEEQIREEAVELLKSKGFHNFQGILDHQYDDDLESVGGSVKSSSRMNSSAAATAAAAAAASSNINKQQQTIKLGEIHSLRQQILLQQAESDRNLPTFNSDEDDDDEDNKNEQQLQGFLRRTSSGEGGIHDILPIQPIQPQSANPAPEQVAPEDNEDAVRAWKVMKQLKVRLLDVFTDDHYIVEAMGRRGSPSHTRVVIDENAFARHKLRDAMEKRVSLVFTGDHHIVCSSGGDGDNIGVMDLHCLEDESSVIQESLSGDTNTCANSPKSEEEEEQHDDANEEKKEQLDDYRSPELRERLSDSFFAFEAMMRARQQAVVELEEEDAAANNEVVSTSKDLPTTTAEPTIRNQADMLPSMPSVNQADVDDDQSCYSEYTVETTTITANIDTSAFCTGNRQSILSTATAVEGNMYPADKDGGGMLDDSRKTIKANNSQAVRLASQLEEEYIASKVNEAEVEEVVDDDSYAEYTITEEFQAENSPSSTAAANPFRMPGQAQLPIQSRGTETADDHSYMELTVGEGDSNLPDISPPTRLPPRRQDRSDDESFMEVTIADQVSNPSVLMSPPDLTSPHLTSMLSSRMFADMQLPPELQQQQAQQRSVDGDHEFYPTITIHPDDDEMTQLTFDHTMEDTISAAAQDHHNHAAQYLDNSSSNNSANKVTKETFRSSSSFNNVDVTSVVGSQHTEQTRDTTVSDDASSTQQDGASFKSCVSTESSQFVAELLRRDIWSPEAVVVQTALEKLGKEANKGFHERSNIVRYGGLLAMLRAMEMKPDQREIQIAAFGALEMMSMDASTQVAIGEVGGIPAIANSMKGHWEDVVVQQAACKALCSLTRHRDGGSLLSQDPIPTEGVVETVTKTMQKYAEDADIQAHAFSTLANLCLDNQARLRELKKWGGLAAMTMALQVPWTNQTDQHEAISTLSILLRSMTLLDKK